ncbi:MAG: helix-turn-helix domain-containing protein [Kordiimonas sp.]
MLSVLLFLRTSLYGEWSYIVFLLEYPAIVFLAFDMCEFGFSLTGAAGIKRPRFFRPITAIAAVLYFGALANAVNSGSHIYSVSYAIPFILPMALFGFTLVYMGMAGQKLAQIPVYNIWKLYKAKHTLSHDTAAILGLFASLCLCLLLLVLVLIVRDSVIARAYLNILFSTTTTLIICSIVITYLYYVEQRLEISTKITGGLTVLVLSSAALLFALLYDQNTSFVPQQKRLLETQSLQFTAHTNNAYEAKLISPAWQNIHPTKLDTADAKSVMLELPFTFPFWGSTYSQLELHVGGYAIPHTTDAAKVGSLPTPKMTNGCFGAVPSIVPFCNNPSEYEIYLHIAENGVTATWQPKKYPKNIFNSRHQMHIGSDGTITFSYQSLPNVASAIWLNTLGISNGETRDEMPNLFRNLPTIFTGRPIWFDLTLEQRLVTNQIYWPLSILLVVMTIMLWFVLKPYLHQMLSEPIEQILTGLQKVDAGRLDIDIPADAKDELGDLARGFTRMTRSLQEARQRNDEQTELLEQELAERARKSDQDKDIDIPSKNEVFEQRVHDVIIKNIGNFEFQVNELAEEMGVSTRQLHRRLVTVTAKTPAALVRSIRLERAKLLLSAQAVNVSEAAHQTGFRDVGYFSRLFVKQYGISPSDLLE